MNEFRIRMTTTDGCLVQNRLGTRDLWLDIRHGKLILDKEVAEQILENDCREKGVRLISYVWNESGVDATVAWL